MNIAIVISVSEYTDPQDNLPGCKKDSDTVYTIINKIKKFDEVLYLHEKLSSTQVKQKFTDFISKYKTEQIDELFFYFSGHGKFKNDEFYYILSDYNEFKTKQTTLQNEEIDSLFRLLNPNLVVKVIDACQSGKSYIKEPGAVKTYFTSTKNEFKKCYFLSSSLKDQSSFQTDEVSDFTLSFIKSIKEHEASDIRYKHIIDYISDDFENNPSQTPFFVTQADQTEKFCTITPELKEYLERDISQITVTTKVKQQEISILDKVKKDASEYLNKEQAIKVIEDVKDRISSFALKENLEELYDLDIVFDESYDLIVDDVTIGKWLNENPNNFFAHSVSKRLRKDRNSNPFHKLTFSYMDMIGNSTDYESVMVGFDLDIEVPYKTISISLLSKFPNLESFTTRIVYVLSKKIIRFFYFITNFEENGWDSKTLNKDISWSTNEHLLYNTKAVEDAVEDIFNELQETTLRQLEERFKDTNNMQDE